MPRISRTSIILTLFLVIGFLGGILFLSSVGSVLPNTNSHPIALQQAAPQPPTKVTAQGKELLNQFSAAFEAAADKINPSVVPIFSEQVEVAQNPFGSPNDPLHQFFGDDFFRHFFGNQGSGEQKQTVHALGSGVIVTSDGYILTNNHVVNGAGKLTVVLQDKQRYTAKVVGTDPQTDVAVVKIDAKNLPAASLGNSDDVRVGQWVIAVGNPFQLMHTVTAGIISAKGRSSVNLAEYEDFIQTDASINPGNSGGALADLDGNVVGINTAIYSPSGAGGNVGIGFAIPIKMAKNIMNQLVEKGKITRGYLGLLPQDIDQNLASALKLNSTSGALVGDVTPDGPADKAGIQRGDIITTYNGTPVTSSVELRNMVAQSEPGTAARVDLLRNGKQIEKTVRLAERPKNLANRENGRQNGDENQNQQSNRQLGLSVQNLTADIATQLGYQHQHGVLVTQVEPGSPAEDAGIQPNDLIQEINREKISSVNDFNRTIQNLGSGDNIAFLVRRGNNTFYAAVQVPRAS